MLNTILGSKGYMNQSFIEGRRIPVTKIAVGPCTVTAIKNMEKDGYWAVQLGFQTKKAKHTSKALQGHFKKSQNLNPKDKEKDKDSKGKQTYPKYLREVRLASEPEFKVGDVVVAGDVLKKGDIIAVTGISKGKGFAGGVKRHGFRGGSRTHGQSDRERAPGSIGQTTTPGRVYKGKRMAGRMGGEQVTVKNLQIVSVDGEINQIEVAGPVPGIPDGLLVIRKIREGKLEGIQEVQAQVVEGEVPEGEAKPETSAEVKEATSDKSASQQDKSESGQEGESAS